MLSLGIRLLAVGVLVGLYAANATVGVVALGTVFGYVVFQRSWNRESRQP